MRFKLTIKKQDASIQTAEIIAKIMKHLYQECELIDDLDLFCNKTLEEILTARQIKDLAVMVFGNDLPSIVEKVKVMRLIGDRAEIDNQYCPECGSPQWDYISGGMVCGTCGHTEPEQYGYYDGEIGDYSGFVAL